MDRIQELLGRLADISDAEVAELEGIILSEFDATEADEPTADNVEKMISLADALDNVRGEVTRRNELAETLATKAAEARSRVKGDTPSEPAAEEAPADAPESEALSAEAPEESATSESEPAEADLATAKEDEEENAETAEDQMAEVAEGVAEDEAEAEADMTDEEKKRKAAAYSSTDDSEQTSETVTETPAEAEASTDESAAEAPATEESPSGDDNTLSADADDTTPEEDAVTASAENGTGVVVTPPADAAPVIEDTREGVQVTITAGADIPGFGTGAQLGDLNDVAKAFANRLHTLRNVQGGGGSQHTVASLSFDFPEDRKLVGEDGENYAKVLQVTSPQALTAAAGVCAPLETKFDITICGDDDRPIRDALARFNADRGGLRIWPAPTLPTGAADIWDPGAPATKTCADATCPTVSEVGVKAIYSCLKFSNYTNRFFPEVVKANTDLAMIEHARVAELNLMAEIAAVATDNTLDFGAAKTGMLAPSTAGVTRAVIVALRNTAAYIRKLHRLGSNSPMRAILPNWVLDAMVADLALQMPGDGLETLSVSEAQINSLLRNAGINVAWSLDNWDATGAGATAPVVADGGFEASVSFPMFPEGSFLFLDGGTLDLGVQRDGTMIADNEYATFVETFEGVAKIGCDAYWLTVPVCVSGAAAALVDTTCGP
jgi:hypothetical protein